MIQGAIYDKLYAPGSTKVSSERQRQGQELITRIYEVLSMNEKCFAEPGFLREHSSFKKTLQDVCLYGLLTLVYRAMPEAANSHQLSLQAARSTMQVHSRSRKEAESMGPDCKLELTTWSLMMCPFTSFIVLFRNVITDLNIDDLNLLGDFVASMGWLNDNDHSEPIQRFKSLCHAFYTLAKHFVTARLRANNEQQAPAGANQMHLMNILHQTTSFNQPMNALAFPEDFQTWMDTNMDSMNDNWLAFGTI